METALTNRLDTSSDLLWLFINFLFQSTSESNRVRQVFHKTKQKFCYFVLTVPDLWTDLKDFMFAQESCLLFETYR